MDKKDIAYQLHLNAIKLRIIKAALKDRVDDELSKEIFLVEDSLNTIAHALLNARPYDLTSMNETEK